ncbi:hypothetical protein AV530_002899 [Patagioenas fasciata monilis]|uniref:Uncharacterized protein n=1 Tax=Patagioenas fasciata monilis TaxID=372326 RepID=A0A1V4K9V0_PATFA|nr:hypothetical protein AV530_002899 [Patagioenas fasciata monilis]
MSGPHSCKRFAFTMMRESIKRKGERCEQKILGNLMTGKMTVLAKDFSEDWKKQQDWDQLSVGKIKEPPDNISTQACKPFFPYRSSPEL